MSDQLTLGIPTMGEAPDAAARRVLAGRDCPWPPTEMQRQVLAILVFHVGLLRAVPVRSLMITLRNSLKRNPTEREIKDSVRSLVCDFKLRIGASRSDPPGYYLIANAEEARAAARPYISEIRNLVRRVRVLLDRHQLAELGGQLSFDHEQEIHPGLEEEKK